MKRNFYIYILFVIILLLHSCTGKQEAINEKAVNEAEELVKNTHNVDSLKVFIDHYSKTGNKSAEVVVREALGKLYRDCSDFKNAFIQHDSAIVIAKSINDTLRLIRAYNQQGTNFRRIGDINEASLHHYKALELCDKCSDTSFVARKNRVVSLNGLGNILLSMGNYEEAYNIFQSALEGEHSLGSALGQAINLANIGSIYEHKNSLDSARKYYNKSMNLNVSANNSTGIGLCYQYLGKLDNREGNTESATANYRKSYEVLRSTGDYWHWLEATIALSHLYLEAYKADSARKYINLTYNTSMEIGSKEHLVEAYSLLSQYEEIWGAPSLALKYYKASYEYKDSLISEKDYNNMQNMRVQYESIRRNQELMEAKTQARKEKYQHRITIGIGCIILFIMALISGSLIYGYRAKKKSNEALKSANETMMKADEELRKADEELRKADSERQAFYRDIAHRFRTPLTVVIGMTQQLREHINEDDEQAIGDFCAVERQNAELLRLVNEMMHKLQPNASTATITAIGGSYQVGNLSDIDIDYETNNTTASLPINNLEAVNTNGKQPLIILAEDNEDVARYQCELLERNGYRVNWATDGVIALELIKEEMPDLVITDIMMPHMDGLELCRNIRNDKETSHLPLIVVTARVEDRDRMKGLEAGAEVYLTKPFLGRELLLNIKNLLEQRAKLRQIYSYSINTVPHQDIIEPPIIINSTKEGNSFEKMINEIIDTNMSDTTFNSTILAANMCLSRAQLNRRINTEFNTDTSHYIRERRLEHACKMLKDTSATIMDIQIACGFDTPGYFSRVFKQHFEMSPSEYRKTHK